MEEFKPGQVISPQTDQPGANDQPAANPVPPAATPQPQRPTEQIPEVPAPTQGNEPPAGQAATAAEPLVPQQSYYQPQPQEATEQPQPVSSAHQDGNWQFHQEQSDGGAVHDAVLTGEISWTASEFVLHDKSAGWYGLLALGGALSALLVYWLTKDKITTGIIVFAVLAFGFLAARRPKEQAYAIDHAGLHVGRRSYDIHNFKSFSVAEDGHNATVVFMPLKRFMPPLTIYLSPDSGEKVVDFLAQILPFEQHRQDAVDSLMKRIRF